MGKYCTSITFWPLKMRDANAQESVSIKKLVDNAAESISSAAKNVYEAEIPTEQLFEIGGGVFSIILFLFFAPIALGIFFGVSGLIGFACGKVLIFPIRVLSFFALRRDLNAQRQQSPEQSNEFKTQLNEKFSSYETAIGGLITIALLICGVTVACSKI